MNLSFHCYQTNKDSNNKITHIWLRVFINNMSTGDLSLRMEDAIDLKRALGTMSSDHKLSFKDWPEEK